MQKQFLNFRKVFTNIAFSPLILISNNSELAAKYLPNDFEQKFINSEINNKNSSLFQGLYTNQEKNFFIAENNENHLFFCEFHYKLQLDHLNHF